MVICRHACMLAACAPRDTAAAAAAAAALTEFAYRKHCRFACIMIGGDCNEETNLCMPFTVSLVALVIFQKNKEKHK